MLGRLCHLLVCRIRLVPAKCSVSSSNLPFAIRSGSYDFLRLPIYSEVLYNLPLIDREQRMQWQHKGRGQK